MAKINLPRLMLGGVGGDCGKTFLSLGLAAAWRNKGLDIAPFKKGPDYIDAAWLALASGRPARNLDTWMIDPQTVLRSFTLHAVSDGINLVEGNRGLHDGESSTGTHSSAELSKLLKIPVIVIIPAVKVTRTAAAVALGLKMLDPQVDIAGVILNRVATSRQERVIRTAVEDSTGLPVVGSVPRIDEGLLSSRHLGLVTPEEHLQSSTAIASAAQIIENSVDLDRLKHIAEGAAPLEKQPERFLCGNAAFTGLRIGHFQSPAFTFYYPENLEAIDNRGALRTPINPLCDPALPELDALYIGGGFPETHASLLSSNTGFLRSVASAAGKGLPIWAECGGLIFLCRSVYWDGRRYAMAGVFPVDITLNRKPAGHGYEEVVVDRDNPFIRAGTVLRGHEFHYSRPETDEIPDTIFKVKRGTGLGSGRDGLIFKRTMAAYMHLHALGTAEWITGLLNAAAEYRSLNKSEIDRAR